MNTFLSFSLFVSYFLVFVSGQDHCNFHYDGYIPPPVNGTTPIYYPDKNETGLDWGECPGSVCDNGTLQSPIDLNSKISSVDEDYGFIDFFWQKNENVSLLWTGNNQMYSVNAVPQTHPSWIMHSDLPDEKFYLNQFHLHQPSEHTINGSHYAAEVHFVHQNQAHNVTAVVGFMFAVGTENDWSPFFDLMLNDHPSAEDPADVFTLGTVYPSLALAEIEKKSYYHYIGSFTTPPCAEGVNWFVMQEPIMIHADQLAQLEKYQTVNNRPIQPAHGRKVVSFVEDAIPFCSKVGTDCSTCEDACKKSCKGTCQDYKGNCKSTCKDQCVKKLCSEVCQ